jgi:hypothetical protein
MPAMSASDSGLSLRMQKTLTSLLPAQRQTAPPTQYNPATAIDLSNAQNEVLRAELLEFLKSVVEDGFTDKVRYVMLCCVCVCVCVVRCCTITI